MDATTLTARLDRENALRKASLLSMPREVQDQIFGYVLKSSHCVSYVDKEGVQIYDHDNIEHNMSALASNDTMARGLCAAFYQYNTFRLHDYQLLEFLGSTQHKSANGDSPKPRTTRKQRALARSAPRFEVKKWIKKLIVRLKIINFITGQKHQLVQLRKLLECPRLTNLVLDIESDPESLPDFSDDQVSILKELKAKLGEGLKVFCDMGYSYGNPAVSSDWRRDISGMFQEQVERIET